MPLFKFMKSERGLYDKLTSMAHTLRKLHDHTRSYYSKQDEFKHFHKVLDQLQLNPDTRLIYNRLLGDWWYDTLIDQPHGCMIHSDPNPVNYVFDHDKVYVLDFESSWEHANFVHDLGIVAAELKHYFAMHKGNDQRAEPYIGHFLWHYSRSMEEFRRTTQALPFFISLGLLRMASTSGLI
jgi:Ser/Thr protein kinase RdoA (MazF antagonist)